MIIIIFFAREVYGNLIFIVNLCWLCAHGCDSGTFIIKKGLEENEAEYKCVGDTIDSPISMLHQTWIWSLVCYPNGFLGLSLNDRTILFLVILFP